MNNTTGKVLITLIIIVKIIKKIFITIKQLENIKLTYFYRVVPLLVSVPLLVPLPYLNFKLILLIQYSDITRIKIIKENIIFIYLL